MKSFSVLEFFACAAALLLSSNLAHATAGPPLVTDDPGTPGPNNWEINTAFTSESSMEEKRMELPLLDINYGWGERIQLKYEVPYVISKNEEQDSKHSGIDRSSAGVKWRFQDKEAFGAALSTYPQITFKSPVSESARNSDGPGYSEVFLPIEAEESSGKWDFNQEVGYRWIDVNRSQWAAGIALTYNLKESVAFLGEIHLQAPDNFSDREILSNIGTIVGLGKISSLLFSIGRTFDDFGSDPHRTLIYAGLQFHL